MMSHHLAMFGGYWSNTNEDINYLICHVTSRRLMDEVTFLGGSSLWYVTTLPSLVALEDRRR